MQITNPPATHPAISASIVRHALPQGFIGIIRVLFDRSFYESSNPDIAAACIDPFEHFLTCGLFEGRSPHALFDPHFYAAQLPPEAGDIPPFLHYLQHGAIEKRDPHPLFDTSYYIGRTEHKTLYGQVPLSHFVSTGTRLQLACNPLFDPDYYRRCNAIGASDPRHPILHYIAQGWRDGCRTHPLFDAPFYLSRRPDVAASGIDPLAHYLRHGCHEQVSPHELFDLETYGQGCGGLLHYASHPGEDLASPHPLFDPNYYRQIHGIRTDPFLHFLEHGLSLGLDPHPLFDCGFYLQRYPDVQAARIPPFLHFVRHGATEGRNSCEFFDAARYVRLRPDAERFPLGAVSHYLAHAPNEAVVASEKFDPIFYADCCMPAVGNDDPLLHYLTSGRALGLAAQAPDFETFFPARPGAQKNPAATSILLICKDAGADGTARPALRAAQILSKDPDLACHVLLLDDGPLRQAFEQAVPTVRLKEPAGALALIHAFARLEGLVVFCDACLPELARCATRLEVRMLTWLHELPPPGRSTACVAETLSSLLRTDSPIVAASNHTRAEICGRFGGQQERIMVLGDGCDGGSLASLDPAERRRLACLVREELGMPPDAILVLSTGAVDFKNGADIFIRVAFQALQQAGKNTLDDAAGKMHFVWAGAARDPAFAALCRQDLHRLGLQDRVHFVDGSDRQERLQETADLIVAPGRGEIRLEDAMLAARRGLTVLGFDGEVRFADLPDGCKLTTVPYLDIDAMACRVIALGKRPTRRRARAPQPQGQKLPDWEHWRRQFRDILCREFAIPVACP